MHPAYRVFTDIETERRCNHTGKSMYYPGNIIDPHKPGNIGKAACCIQPGVAYVLKRNTVGRAAFSHAIKHEEKTCQAQCNL